MWRGGGGGSLSGGGGGGARRVKNDRVGGVRSGDSRGDIGSETRGGDSGGS